MLVLSPPPPRHSESKPCSPRSLPVVLFSRRFSPIRSFLPAFLPGLASTDCVPPGVAFLPDFLPVSAFSPGVPPRFGLFSRRSSPYLPVRNSLISHKVRTCISMLIPTKSPHELVSCFLNEFLPYLSYVSFAQHRTQYRFFRLQKHFWQGGGQHQPNKDSSYLS